MIFTILNLKPPQKDKDDLEHCDIHVMNTLTLKRNPCSEY